MDKAKPMRCWELGTTEVTQTRRIPSRGEAKDQECLMFNLKFLALLVGLPDLERKKKRYAMTNMIHWLSVTHM